jgi:hypothetical protein
MLAKLRSPGRCQRPPGQGPGSATDHRKGSPGHLKTPTHLPQRPRREKRGQPESPIRVILR